MAPEQVLRTNVGPWTDLYAVATMLFEMLLGRLEIMSILLLLVPGFWRE